MPQYVYHAVPSQVVGHHLMPLNRLQEVDRALYEQYLSKYVGRKQVMQQRITILDCLWNDVIFLMAVDPQALAAQFEVIFKHPFPVRHYYRLDVDELTAPMAVKLYDGPLLGQSHYEPFDRANLDQYAALPSLTLDYFREQAMQPDVHPFLFLYVPHLLYQGEIDISSARTLDLVS